MDISIYRNYTDRNTKIIVSKYDRELFCCNSLLAIACHSGSGRYKFHIREIEVKTGEVLIIPAGMPFLPLSYSEDFDIDLLRVGNEHLELLDRIISVPQIELLLMGIPVIRLTSSQMEMFLYTISYIEKLLAEYKTEKQPKRDYTCEIIQEYLHILTLEASRILTNKDARFMTFTAQGEVSMKFFNNLKKYYKDRETVQFYAGIIGINPKRLSKIIYENTGKTAAEWIDQFTLAAAKRMLLNENMKLQEISYDLNFATPSHFSKFFKTKTGMTPSQFKDCCGHA